MLAALLNSPAIDRFGWVLVHSMWQFAGIAVATMMLVRAMRRSSANSRYAMLLLSLLAVVVVPLATWFVLSNDRTSSLEVVASARATETPATSPARDREPVESTAVGIAAIGSEPRPRDHGIAVAPANQSSLRSWWLTVERMVRPWLRVVVAAWCVGFAIFALRPLLSWYTSRRLRTADGTPAPDRVRHMLDRMTERLRLRGGIHVLQSTLVKVPAVVGSLRPVILLPISIISGLSNSQLEAILAHELAHVRRHDFVVNLVQTLVETVFFYHPAVWWLSRRIRVERENCCDDMAIAATGNRREYGRALLALAELGDQQIALALGAKDSSLVARIRRLVRQERSPGIVSGGSLVAVGLLLAAAITAGVWAATPDDEDADEASQPAVITAAVRSATPDDKDAADASQPAARFPSFRLDGLKPTPEAIRVNLKLDRNEFLLGESIAVEYEMTNVGEALAPYDKGAFYPTYRINGAFPMSAARFDENGKSIGKPVDTLPTPMYLGGLVTNSKLKPGESHSTTLFVTRVIRFTKPGRYRLRIENVHGGTTTAYSSGETILTLKQPTPAQARAVYQRMKGARREAYDDRAMAFRKDAADFTTMHHPVYLPLLAEFLTGGDLDALSSLERMEQLAANEVMVGAMARALDRDDWQTARACYQHMKQSLPSPHWFDDPTRDVYKKERARVARTWKGDFGPVLIRLARRLTDEVASPTDATTPRRELTQEDAQALLREIEYIYRCVGRPEDFGDCLKACAISIELTKTLPLETQWIRPRGSAHGFRYTVCRMLGGGAQPPASPSHPGEAAAFVIALSWQPGFRPEGWQAEIMKWLRSDTPYLAEVILYSLPDPIPDEVFDYLPTALAHDYVDLQIAACRLAERHPRAAYREPLKNILETATDKYLRRYAVEAARANGLSAEYDADAPFVDQAPAEDEATDATATDGDKSDDTKKPEDTGETKAKRDRFSLHVAKLSKEQVEQLAWGKESHGLRAALLFEPQKNVVAMGDILKQSYVVRNAGETPLELTATPWLSTDLTKLEVVDQDGKAIAVERISYSGAMPLDTCTLRPGEAVKIPLRDMSIGAGKFDDPWPDILKPTPGQTCRLRGQLSIERVALADGDDADESRSFWLGTGVVEFRVTDQDDTAADASFPVAMIFADDHDDADRQEAEGVAGNGFGRVVTRELELGGESGRSRLRLDTGKLLPAFGDSKPTRETWRAEEGTQIELVRRNGGIALAFYNVCAKHSKTPWSELSPVRVWGTLGGSFAFFRGEAFSVLPIDLDRTPVTLVLDGGGKLEVTEAAFKDALTIKLRYAFIEREASNHGDVIVVQGMAPAERKGLPPLKWGKPLEGLVAAHEILAVHPEVRIGQKVTVRHYVRNEGESTVSFQYYSRNHAFLSVAAHEDGKWRDGHNVERLGRAPNYRVVLHPGEEWNFGKHSRRPGERSTPGNPRVAGLAEMGAT
ncbi:MAG: M56 family metallopeptidase [Planctomycetota bacterium]|jgi:beta-lactamase regulating signal transducer with metallopeptidase domain